MYEISRTEAKKQTSKTKQNNEKAMSCIPSMLSGLQKEGSPETIIIPIEMNELLPMLQLQHFPDTLGGTIRYILILGNPCLVLCTLN